MKTLPLLASFALVSTLTACTTIRSVEPAPAPAAPANPISNSQTVETGATLTPAETGTGTEMSPIPSVFPNYGTGVSEPTVMPVPTAPANSNVWTGTTTPESPTITPAPTAPVVPAPQASTETFSKTVSYSSPAGQDEITFSLETKEGIITSLVVTPKTANPVSSNYQKNFASKAPAQVVGKALKGLKVSTVSGGSLTTWAFNEFVVGL